MKLHCTKVYPDYAEMFTSGKLYPVETISPNKLMVSVLTDGGDECAVVYQTSVYGKFTLLEGV